MSSYINLTITINKPLQTAVNDWKRTDSPDFLKNQVLTRGGNLVLVPMTAISTIADTIIGMGAGVASIVTLGKHSETYWFARMHLGSSRLILARPFTHILKTINPNANFTTSSDVNGLMRLTGATDLNPVISSSGDGFTHSFVCDFLRDIAHNCYNSNNAFKAHVASRLTYAVMLVAAVITRIVDIIIGFIAMVAALITLGKVDSLNNLAARGLQVTGIVNDIFYCTIKMINPFAGAPQ